MNTPPSCHLPRPSHPPQHDTQPKVTLSARTCPGRSRLFHQHSSFHLGVQTRCSRLRLPYPRLDPIRQLYAPTHAAPPACLPVLLHRQQRLKHEQGHQTSISLWVQNRWATAHAQQRASAPEGARCHSSATTVPGPTARRQPWDLHQGLTQGLTQLRYRLPRPDRRCCSRQHPCPQQAQPRRQPLAYSPQSQPSKLPGSPSWPAGTRDSLIASLGWSHPRTATCTCPSAARGTPGSAASRASA